jgi:serine/threonine-protein kinase
MLGEACVTPERWYTAKRIFQDALEREPAERAAFVAAACATDADLRHEVESLLAAYDRPEGVSMDDPLVSGGRDDPDRGPPDLDPLPDRVVPATPAKACPACGSKFPAGAAVCPHDGEVLVEDPEALVGATLDGLYRVERLLGQGSMGAVYLATHLLLRDRVAVKVLPARVSADAEWLRRFLREGRAARAIDHPSAVTVHELRASGEGPAYMVLEYIDGHTLRAELKRRGAMSVEEALAVLGPVAGALDAAHACGVVHRDLKPENIMLGTVRGKAVVKLLDLGIAKLREAPGGARDGLTALTTEGQLIGTPRYMSPEQWGEVPRDGAVEIDGRADVYSLGLMLYELVGGRRPFAGQTVAELRRAHVTEAAAPLDAIAPGVPPGVSEAVARAMAKDRSERQATPGQLIGEVEAGLAAHGEGRGLRPGASAAPVIREPSRDGASRGRARTQAAGLGLCTLLLLAGTGGYAVWEGRDVASDPPPAGATQAPPTAEAGRVLGYRLVAQRFRNDDKPLGEEFSVEERSTFDAEVGLRLAVSSPQDGYLYVLGEAPQPDGANGLPRYTVFYPRRDTNAHSPRLEAGHVAEGLGQHVLRFTGKPGTETLWLIWSSRALPTLDDIGTVVNHKQKGRITDRAQVLAVRAVLSAGAGREPALEVDDTGQTRVRCEGDVLVHAIRIAHT